MLETTILDQVRSVFQHLEARYVFHITYHPGHEQAQELIGFLKDVASCSDKLSCRMSEIENPVLEFTLLKDDVETGIKFRGIPGGHEFTSLLLAVLNADGKGKNLPDEAIRRRIRALQGDISLQTYVSLTCTNCPDVVQALNIIALLNPHVTHEMVDGALNQEEVDALKIQAVPSVYANGKLLHVGRGSLGELLQKLEEAFGSAPQEDEAPIERDFDVLVLGGGPAGASAAIYSARKGLRVAIVAERIGGQVKETVGIENLISVPQTTGAELANALRTHIEHYPIEIFEERKIEKVKLQGTEKSVSTVGGEMFHASAVIIATGASWRKLNVEGEAEYIGRGVAFCPHCDGPFYQGKHVAVIGGGNSGIEAAIDLAGICRKVTVFEFADTLKADQVLQEKARSLPNVEIFTSSQTIKVDGNGEKVTSIRIKDRLISVPQTTGAELANALRTHIEHYPIEIFEERKIEKVKLQGTEKSVSTVGGEMFHASAVIIATGASWRKLNVEGEAEYIGRGVAFCPHCDGPFYQGKHVAVIGGGNSGIEAAIDLAGICRKVTVFEFADTLKADQVLQEKARSLPNVEIFTSSQTIKVDGNGEKVTSIRIKDRLTGEERDFPLDGIFVQIGLAANSAPFRNKLETTPTGEIKIDAFCRTTLPGVYAAGDVSNVPYKQIVIAMGEGAKAALSAFDDRIRGVI